jgi:hypothetical protein
MWSLGHQGANSETGLMDFEAGFCFLIFGFNHTEIDKLHFGVPELWN